MSYDYFKHFVRDAYDAPLEWEDERFHVDLPSRFGGRLSIVMPFAAWGNLLVVPILLILISDGVDNVRQAVAATVLLSIGSAMLYITAHFAFQRLRIEGDADALALIRVPLPPRARKTVPLGAISKISAERRAVTRWQRFSSRSGKVDPTYLPWTVVIEADERVVLPVHLRPEEARKLAEDLRAALDEAKRRRAERGGFRG